MTTKIKVGGITIDTLIDPDKFETDITVDGMMINDAFINQAGLTAYYGALLASAGEQSSKMKVLRDATIAKVGQEIREAAAAEKRKVTEASIGEEVTLDPRVQAIRLAYDAANRVESECYAAIEALKSRRDMLIQMGASAREEKKGDIRIKTTEHVSARGEEMKARLRTRGKKADN